MVDDWLARIDAFEWLVVKHENMHVEVAKFADLYVMATEQTRPDNFPIESMWFAEVSAPGRVALGERLAPFVQGTPKWTAGPGGGADPFHGEFKFTYHTAGAGYRGSWELVRDAEGRYREIAEDSIDDPAGSVPLEGSDRVLTAEEARAALKKQMGFTTSNTWLLPYVSRVG